MVVLLCGIAVLLPSGTATERRLDEEELTKLFSFNLLIEPEAYILLIVSIVIGLLGKYLRLMLKRGVACEQAAHSAGPKNACRRMLSPTTGT